LTNEKPRFFGKFLIILLSQIRKTRSQKVQIFIDKNSFQTIFIVNIQVACLPTAEVTHGDACWVAGWGTTSYGGDTSNALQSVGVNIFSQEYCIANTLYTGLMPDDICAGIPDTDGIGGADGGKGKLKFITFNL
jgi:hypothetical protein